MILHLLTLKTRIFDAPERRRGERENLEKVVVSSFGVTGKALDTGGLSIVVDSLSLHRCNLVGLSHLDDLLTSTYLQGRLYSSSRWFDSESSFAYGYLNFRLFYYEQNSVIQNFTKQYVTIQWVLTKFSDGSIIRKFLILFSTFTLHTCYRP